MIHIIIRECSFPIVLVCLHDCVWEVIWVSVVLVLLQTSGCLLDKWYFRHVCFTFVWFLPDAHTFLSHHCACAHLSTIFEKRFITIPLIKIVRLKTVLLSVCLSFIISCGVRFGYPLQMFCLRSDKQSLCEGLPERQTMVSVKARGKKIW